MHPNQVHPGRTIHHSLALVANGTATMTEAMGPAICCLMASPGTNIISSRIYNLEDPMDLR